MSYYHYVADNIEMNRVKKELNAAGDDNAHMFVINKDKICMFKGSGIKDPIILTDDNGHNELIDFLIENRLLGEGYDYANDRCVTMSELQNVTNLGTALCGEIVNRKLKFSESTITDLSILEKCQSLTDISGVVNGKYCNMFAMTSLQVVRLPENLEEIGNCAFAFCVALNDIVIPENVKNIKTKAFYNCLSLQNIVIPENVTNIGADAFAKSANLYQIDMLAEVPPTIYNDTFTGIAADYVIYVPKGCGAVYKKEWSSHVSHIVER